MGKGCFNFQNHVAGLLNGSERHRCFEFLLGLCQQFSAPVLSTAPKAKARRVWPNVIEPQRQVRNVRDPRLPTGVVVTKVGFLIGADGTRTEQHEGQACDLQGNVVAYDLVLPAPTKMPGYLRSRGILMGKKQEAATPPRGGGWR